jgi:hypothetical protein
MAEPVLTGSCGCGAVRFEVSEPLLGAVYCHCTRCQKRSGTAAAASARAVPGSVTITAGEDRLREWRPGGLARAFCGDCGSHMFSRDPDTGDVAVVRLSAIDGDPGVRPSAHMFVAYAAEWEELRDVGLPRHPERAPAP